MYGMHDSHEIGSNQTSGRDKLLKNFFMEKVMDSKKTYHYTGRQINLCVKKVYFVNNIHVQAKYM